MHDPILLEFEVLRSLGPLSETMKERRRKVMVIRRTALSTSRRAHPNLTARRRPRGEMRVLFPRGKETTHA